MRIILEKKVYGFYEKNKGWIYTRETEMLSSVLFIFWEIGYIYLFPEHELYCKREENIYNWARLYSVEYWKYKNVYAVIGSTQNIKISVENM